MIFGSANPLSFLFPPNQSYLFLKIQTPKGDTSLAQAHYLSHALGSRIKLGMSQETANENSCFIGCDRKVRDAIFLVAEPPVIKPHVACKENRTHQRL